MSTEENKAVVRRLIEDAWNQGNLAVVDELVVPDHVAYGTPRHSGLMEEGAEPFGPEYYKQRIVRLHAAFPDFHMTIEDQIAEGDKVVTRISAHGTHQGGLRGHSPTGKEATWSVVHIDRIVDGKVVEGWSVVNLHHQMQQLGLLPHSGKPS
jgi:predicted ester cyclase